MKTFHYLAAGLSLAAALAPVGARAQSEPVTLYGRLNVALESMQNSVNAQGRSVNVARESNDRSVIGLRGAEDLGDGVQALFQVEGTLAPDTGAGSPAARDTRVGLATPYGTLFGGNWVTPYNGATAGLDPFYPTTAGYMSIMGNGSAPTTDNIIDTSSFDRRQQNSVHYWSPDWHGLSLRVAQGLNEERPANGARPALTSIVAIDEHGPLYLTAAYERHHDYQGPGLDDSGAKIGAAWNFGTTRVAAIAERLRYATLAGTLSRMAYYASVSHQMGAQAVHLAVGHAADGQGNRATGRIGYITAGADTGATHYTAGWDYAFSKRTSVFLYFTLLHNDRNGVYDFGINSLGAAAGATLKGSALGLRHNF
jgi:predicted porin